MASRVFSVSQAARRYSSAAPARSVGIGGDGAGTIVLMTEGMLRAGPNYNRRWKTSIDRLHATGFGTGPAADRSANASGATRGATRPAPGYSRGSAAERGPARSPSLRALAALALASAGAKVFEDRASGACADRPGPGKALDYVRDGDVLIVWKLDRLGRSLPHLIPSQIWRSGASGSAPSPR
jgi:hypothetical protein